MESMGHRPIGSDRGTGYSNPAVAFPGHYVPQGIAADLIATLYGYEREQLDAFALRSHQRAALAAEKGYFRKSLIPIKGIDEKILLNNDENIRSDTSLEKPVSLLPSFEETGVQWGFDAAALQKYPQLEVIRHVHHAGNSLAIVDGAAWVSAGSKSLHKQYELHPHARIMSQALAETEPNNLLLRLAIPKPPRHAQLIPEQIDLLEVNEAFAVVPLRFADELRIPLDKINVNGRAIAMGHPLGAIGAMLIGALLDELERRNLRYGVPLSVLRAAWGSPQS